MLTCGHMIQRKESGILFLCCSGSTELLHVASGRLRVRSDKAVSVWNEIGEQVCERRKQICCWKWSSIGFYLLL